MAFLAVLVAFFALATLFVRACDRLLGPTEMAGEDGRLPGSREAA